VITICDLKRAIVELLTDEAASDFGPRYKGGLARLDLSESPSDLRVPSRFDVVVDRRMQTIDQGPGQSGSGFGWKPEGVFHQGIKIALH
jgi:hypothetical protein